MLKNWLLLALAIIVEVTATSALNASAGFTRPVPVAITIAGYLLSFYLLALIISGVVVIRVFSKTVSG